MNDWISVKDKLPEIPLEGPQGVRVIACCKTIKGSVPLVYERATLKGKTIERWRTWWNKLLDDKEVTHWMYFPDPPKEV